MNRLSGSSTQVRWIFLAIFVQAGIGAVTVPMRYLQMVAGLPGFALVALSDILAFSLASGWFMPRIPRQFWRSKTLWVMVAVVILRTILITFALRFTKAYLVQLINLMAPFLVVLLNRVFLREALPRFTVPAITLSVCGGAMMIFGGKVGSPLTALLITRRDIWGVLLAFSGTFGIAAYMMIVRRSRRIGLPSSLVYIAQIGAMAVVMGTLSYFTGESWRAFLHLDWRGWLAFLSIALGLEIGLKNGNIAVLRKLGAPLVSSMLAVRLVAALAAGWIILGEGLTSLLQWIGAVIVMLTVTGYLCLQNRTESPPDE
jgi:drug/metabolite transporter (DMT)-like permease